jgi:hypothetical protein
MAEDWLAANFKDDWEQVQEKERCDGSDAPVFKKQKTSQKAAPGIGAFMLESEESMDNDREEQAAPQLTEVDRYLSLPQEKACIGGRDLDILQWWKARAGEFPCLSKMARQFLALPASSAGPERLFTKAGKMHDDFKKSTSESTLQHALMVAVNC